MTFRSRIACLALLAALGTATAVWSDDPKGSAPEDKQVVDSKATRRAPATSVNFRKELKLPFDSLDTLGPRIDAARRAPNPVALAHLSSELAVAEKVSGKQAGLTSKALLHESAELAKVRHQAAELQAVANVASQVANEQDLIKNLRSIIAGAQADAQADTQSVQQNQEPTWTPRKVVVNNYTTQLLTIFVNGRYKDEVMPGMAKTIIVEHRWNPTVLTAHGDDSWDNWGPRYIWGRFTTYKWNIN